MNNIYGTVELILEGKEISYVLSALLELDKPGEKKAMTSLAFYKNYGQISEESLEVWDNDIYLYNTLYKNILLPWVNEKTVSDGQEFGSLFQIKGVQIDDFKQLKELFDKAIELGFFNNVIILKKENGK
jgi:hypothetical protein